MKLNIKNSTESSTAAPCCGPTCCTTDEATTGGEKIRRAIVEKYAETARSELTNDNASVQAVAEAFGYSAEELTSIPAEANMGLSCGNPIATANLKAGEVVVDLGSGGGLDVFLAAEKVGPTGRAIGIDMTEDMIARASRAAEKGIDGKPYTNVAFHLASIDAIPLPDRSVDVIISNCVINLAPDKSAVFREMYRVLKPGGRVAVSDIALKKDLPAELAENVMAFVGCIAGAIHIAEYERGLGAAGFSAVAVVDARADLNAYATVEGQSACCTPVPKSGGLAVLESSCCTPSAATLESKASLHDHLGELMRRYNVNEYAASVKVFAIKPL